MDPLYIVEFECSAADPVQEDSGRTYVFDTVLGHVRDWLVQDVYPEPELDLLASGEVDLPFKRAEGTPASRKAQWSTRVADSARITRLTMTQPLQNAPGASFVTDVTLFQDHERVAFRIAMGREIPAGRLIPATVQMLRRPGLLRRVLRDHTIQCRYQNQRVTGKQVWIGVKTHTVLAELLHSEARLPLLLVDARDGAIGGEFARKAAPELAGLAQVVALADSAVRALDPVLAALDLSLPDGGARLIWPSLGAGVHPVLTEDEIRDDFGATQSLLRTIASVSVAARGRNTLTKLFATTERAAKAREFEEAIAQARDTGDTAAEVAAMRERVRTLSEEAEGWVNYADELEQKVAELQSSKSELEYWKGLFIGQQSSRTVAGRTWDQAPAMTSDDFTDLAEFLVEMSGGAVVFTPLALRSWKQSSFPHTDDMHKHLVVLAQAAVEWRNSGCSVGAQLDEWFRLQWGVVMSPTDKGLEAARKHTFIFEGAEYSQVPHLKLADHVSPNEVGRIYFARDAVNQRFIVNHVGLKLYGLKGQS